MESQANGLMWLKGRVHVSFCIWSEITSRKQDGFWGVFKANWAGCTFLSYVDLSEPVSAFKFASAAVESHKINTFSSFWWLILFNSLCFPFYVYSVISLFWLEGTLKKTQKNRKVSSQESHLSWQRKSPGQVCPLSLRYWNVKSQTAIIASEGCFFSAAHMIKKK